MNKSYRYCSFSVKKEDDLVSSSSASPFPHPDRRLITFSLFLWNLIIKAQEKVMLLVFGKVQNFFLSTAIIEMNLYFTFFLSLSHTQSNTTNKQASVEISSEAVLAIRANHLNCADSLRFFFLLH
jgi:hypothetical protein